MSTLNLSVHTSINTITVYPAGRIDSTNSNDLNNYVMSVISEQPHAAILFDCSELQYISSAGLRVLLGLSKKPDTSLRLVNVSPEIMDIFDVTGFSKILDIEEAPQEKNMPEVKDVSCEQAALMGESGGIAVYRMPDDMILKLSPEGTQLADIQAELAQSKAALICGVPTLISYDAVIYNGRYGIRYEMPNAKTISSLINFQQWTLTRHAKEMGRTLRHIHTCRPGAGTLPKTKELFTGYAHKMGKYLTSDEVSKLIDMVNAVPDSDRFVYGNYHSGNVFVQNDDLILINMSGISCGNPIFDLGISYVIYVSGAALLAKPLTGLGVYYAKKFWDIMIKSYFDTADSSILQRYDTSIKAAAILCSFLFPAINNLPEQIAAKFVADTKKNLSAIHDTLIKVLPDININL